jgi:hypothetical protein
MILGLFIVPIAILFKQPRNETNNNGLFIPYKFPKIFWLWDNDRDGICGDNGFKNEHCPDYHLNYGSFLCNYIWCAIRNPIANASWYFGVDSVITKIEYDGNWSFAYDENGKCYAFYKYVGEKIIFYVGYENDNVEDTPKHYTYNIGYALRIK